MTENAQANASQTANTTNRPGSDASALRGVVTNWIWSALVLGSGFIIPRVISDKLSQEHLGVWDLGWSLVSYVRWLQVGLSSSVNRFIARSRAQNDFDGLNAAFNTSLIVLLATCVVGCVFAAGFFVVVPRFLSDTSAEMIAEARIVVILLTLTAALQLPGGVYNAVITGYERFGLLNAIRILRDGAILIAIAVILYRGGTLIQAAWAYLIGEVLGDLAKVIISVRVCPQLSHGLRYCRWKTIKELTAYGGKTLAQGAARSNLYEVNRLLVAWYLGGAAPLAIYSRQSALLKHALRFMKQYAQVFIPRSSALDAGNDRESLARLMVVTSKYGFYTTLPMIAVFCMMGDLIMRLWMGPDYEQPIVLAVIALGHVLLVPQQGVYSVLLGMNRHGWVAIFDWISVAASFAVGWLLLGPMQLGMVSAAIALAIPMTISSGILMPLYACKLLGLPPLTYFREMSIGPLFASMPFVAVLWIARTTLSDRLALPVGLAAGGLVLLPIYWRWVMPAHLRERIVARVFGANSNLGSAVQTTHAR